VYATILGMPSPWEVARVEFDDAAKAIHVWLEARSGNKFACPECQTISPMHDHVERSTDYRNQLIPIWADYTRAYYEFWQNILKEPWRASRSGW
jgi:hypothetical protein